MPDHDIRPSIRHCIYASSDHAHDARMDDDLSNRRWKSETCFSVVKRSQGATVRAQMWCHEFTECVIMVAIYDIERATSAL